MEPSLNFPNAILLSDTREQFQLFQLLEKFLQSPLTFRTQMLCALSQTAQQELIQKQVYFEILFMFKKKALFVKRCVIQVCHLFSNFICNNKLDTTVNI